MLRKDCITLVALCLLAASSAGCGLVLPPATPRPTSTLVTMPSRTSTGTPPTGEPSLLPTMGIADAASACAAPTPTAWNTPNAPLKTATGRVKRVEPLANGGAHIVIVPDGPEMPADWMISDWSHATTLFYWAGLQTPTPVAADQRAAMADTARNHRVTIGYYDTTPRTIILFSIHKQEGDPQ